MPNQTTRNAAIIDSPLVAISYYSRSEHALYYSEHYGARPWSHHRLDAEGGSFTSLALDSFGFPHISYHVGTELSQHPGEGDGSQLRYCWYDGTDWSIESVDRSSNYVLTANVGVEGGIALNQDVPRIAYRAYDYNHGTLNSVVFATRDTGTWARTILAGLELNSFQDFNQGAGAIPVVQLGYDRVVYSSDCLNHSLTSWFHGMEGDSTRTIDHGDTSDNIQGFLHWPAVTLVNDVPHVSYGDVLTLSHPPALDNLKHAWRLPDGTWTHEIVDGPDLVGTFSSIAADPNSGALAISYFDRTTQVVRCARQAGGTWIIDDVEDVDTMDTRTSIAWDRRGGIHVSYYSERALGLRHAWRKKTGAWSIETVMGGEDVGHYSSIEAA